MSPATSDLLLVGLTSLAGSLPLIGWLHFSGQLEFPRTVRRYFWTFIRSGALSCCIGAVARWGLHLAVYEAVVLAVIPAMILPVIPSLDAPERDGTDTFRLGNDELSGGCFIAVWMMILTPLTLLREFVFGETEPRLTQSTTPTISTSPTVAEGQIAIVMSPLKPTGIVLIGDQQFAAASMTGCYIDRGSKVRICEDRHGTLLVRVIDSNQ